MPKIMFMTKKNNANREVMLSGMKDYLINNQGYSITEVDGMSYEEVLDLYLMFTK